MLLRSLLLFSTLLLGTSFTYLEAIDGLADYEQEAFPQEEFLPVELSQEDLLQSNGHSLSLFINQKRAPAKTSRTHHVAIKNLIQTLSRNTTIKLPPIYYVLKSVDASSGALEFEDGSKWQVGWWYRSPLKLWRPGDCLATYYHEGYSNPIRFENFDAKSDVWGDENGVLGLSRAIIKISNEPGFIRLELKNGWAFTYENKQQFLNTGWKIGDRIYVFHKENSVKFDLWNLDTGKIGLNWSVAKTSNAVKPTPPSTPTGIDFKLALQLEELLNRRVVSQSGAVKALAQSILNYCAGLKDEQMPVGAFLFLGPTGVGKTELAKALASELYKDPSALIRFDMSHFSESHSVARLIGSPPGYVNHSEGGQLTQAIKTTPRSIVLLDEIEKANPAVHKLFLPIFDEGYITDSKDEKILCDKTIFIMTSNLCSKEIQKLSNSGCSTEEILSIIEPSLIDKLSPEVYNRVEPVIFQPLDSEAITALVDIMLNDLTRKLKTSKNIDLILAQSVKSYLIEYGYHPTLGARPLKKLIQKTVIATLSQAIISQSIPNGSQIELTYEESSDSWYADWSTGS